MRINKIILDEKEFLLSNMVLIVGANGTGKTRLLDEISSEFAGRERKTNYWSLNFDHEFTQNDGKIWYKHLQQFVERGAVQWYSPFTKTGESHDRRKITQLEYESLGRKNGFKEFFENSNFLRKELSHYLPVEERLNITSEIARKEQSNVISDSLNLLFRNREMLEEIQVQIRKLFKRELYLAPHNDPNLQLKLADSSDEKMPKWNGKDPVKSFAQYQKWLGKATVGDIKIEGHGIRAFLHIMLSYALPTNLVLMIDEPELHLYPSIKKKFGKLLGNLTQKSKKQIICVTHDSDFLQGVFDSKCDLDVLKLQKQDKKYSVISYSYKSNNSLWAKYNQTSFLQLAFLECAIIVEGSTDQHLYEYIFSDQNLLGEVEYNFISAGGNDSISNPEKLAQDLKVPYAIILDFDNLKEVEYEHIEKIRKLKGKKRILELIQKLGPKIKGVPEIKNKGLAAFDDGDLKNEIKAIIRKLDKMGIFIVPCGYLESWAKIACTKAEFPEKFIKKYMESKTEFQSLNIFLKKIEKYLRSEMNR